MWYENIAGRLFGLVTKHACDRWTDRQNYDSQDRTSIAVSRSKNWLRLAKIMIKNKMSRFYGSLCREFRVALPWELLYADDLVVIAETEEDLIKRLNERKNNVEN